MDATDFIALSARLVGQGPAAARSATSRAYYGAFHSAISVLRDVATAPPGNAKQHVLAAEYIMSVNEREWTNLGRLLKDLHGDRLKSDYELADVSAESRAFAQLNVERAQRIEAKLREFKIACANDPALLQKLKSGIANVAHVR